MAAAIDVELKAIGHAVSMTTVLQTTILSVKQELRSPAETPAWARSCSDGVDDEFEYGGVSLFEELPLPSVPSFKEFHFVPGCSADNSCPDDFELLERLSSDDNTLAGSLKHSSTYLYRSEAGADQEHAARTDSQWADAIDSFPVNGTIQTLIDNNAHLDSAWQQT